MLVLTIGQGSRQRTADPTGERIGCPKPQKRTRRSPGVPPPSRRLSVELGPGQTPYLRGGGSRSADEPQADQELPGPILLFGNPDDPHEHLVTLVEPGDGAVRE